MGFFKSTKWIINALVTISEQLHHIQQTLDLLLATSGNVSPEQLAELTQKGAALKAKTKALTSVIIEQNKPK